MDQMFSRNYGYVDSTIQQKLGEATILIAGCGLGSYIAETLVRFGCLNLLLVDHDVVEVHNLNRQDFTYQDIGQLKSESLKRRLESINPKATITAIKEPVSETNAKSLVRQADIIVDTIDFLSAKGLIALYQQCFIQKKTVISSLSAGFGAVAFYIPAENQDRNWFKEIFNIGEADATSPKEYVHYFKKLICKIEPYLPAEAVSNLIHVFNKMEENKPCPASQISPGAMAAASLCTTIFHRCFAEKAIAALPFAMALDMNNVVLNQSFPLT